MKWEILFVLLFVLFPLLQGLLGRGGEPPQLPSAGEEHDDFADIPALPHEAEPFPDEEEHVPGLQAHRERVASGLEALHGPPLEPLSDEEDHVPGLLARRERPAPQPEALHGPTVVSLEPLGPRPAPLRAAFDVEPSRMAEHARLRRGASAPAPAERRPPEPRLRLRGVGELRRAVLLAEVLGPPRSLRTLEDDER